MKLHYYLSSKNYSILHYMYHGMNEGLESWNDSQQHKIVSDKSPFMVTPLSPVQKTSSLTPYT